MDFKKIQMILIITFSVLNLYLLSVLLEKNEELNFGDPSTTVNLQEGLRNDNIKAPELSSDDVEIPFIKTDKDSYLADHLNELSNQTTRMDGGKLLSVLSEPIQLKLDTNNSKGNQLEPLQEFIDGGNVLKANEYEFLSYQAVNQRIVYVQMVNNIPIADGTGSLIFNLNDEGQVTSYEQTHTGPAEIQGRQRSVISEQSAIESLYLSNQIPGSSTIRNVTLSYFQTLSLTDMNIYSPMWYVEIVRDNVPIQVKHVDALTGKIITNSSLVEPEVPATESSTESKSSEMTTNLRVTPGDWLDPGTEVEGENEQRILYAE